MRDYFNLQQSELIHFRMRKDDAIEFPQFTISESDLQGSYIFIGKFAQFQQN